MYKRRNIIERVVGWYKECRRLCTRYEKLAVNYIAMWLVAIARKDGFSPIAKQSLGSTSSGCSCRPL